MIQQSHSQAYIQTPNVHSSTIYSRQDMEATFWYWQMNGKEYMAYIYIYMSNILLYTYNWALKKNEIMSFAGPWMDPEGNMLNEISQTERDKSHDISFYVGS